jgi:hypothetical protein
LYAQVEILCRANCVAGREAGSAKACFWAMTIVYFLSITGRASRLTCTN